MKDDDFKLLKGFAFRQTDERTNERTDICDCRVAFATENLFKYQKQIGKLSFNNNESVLLLGPNNAIYIC